MSKLPSPGAPLRIVLASLVIFTLGFAAGMAAQSPIRAHSDRQSLFEPLLEAYALIESRYIHPVDGEALLAGALDGMARALGDEHSGYIRPELYQRSIDFSGEFTGIGVFVETDDRSGDLRVESVIAGSPAASAGVMAGDVFHKVDGRLVENHSQAELSTLVPGPPGSAVTITFRRGEELLTFEIIRATMVIPNLSWEMVGGGFAYIRMRDFNDLSRSQFDAALAELDLRQTRGMIFDIRGNAGGTLASAIDIASAFIRDGTLLRQVGRDQNETLRQANGSYADISLPLVLLVDESSASAAEVLAGALQDHGMARLIGERTYGKGSVQKILPLANGGGLRLTTGHWLTPAGSWIHGRGIKPDIAVEWHRDNGPPDLQLQAAIAYLDSLGG